MGLDICLIRPCRLEDADEGYSIDGKKTTRNKKIVRSFPQFVIEEMDTEWDFAAAGYPEFDDDSYWETHGWYSTEDHFYITDDESSSGIGDNASWKSFKETLEERGHKILIELEISKIPEKSITYKAVPYKEIGYQRKGANQKFYEDGKWEDPEKCVVTQEELDHDITEYFSSNPESPGGWGSFTEYEGIEDDERLENFVKHIASKFIPGETAVMYW